jgi:hypothetical protein
MATACLFIGWNRPYPGQEKEAYGFLMGEGGERLKQWKKEGWFESSEIIGITPHGGDLNGFILVKGERAKLDELRRTDDFERFSMRAARAFDRWGVVPGVTEEGMQKVMARNPDFVK